jgi:hypothetical protein
VSLTIEQLLAANDVIIRKVPTPEWGGDIYVRTITADDRDRWEKDAASGKPTRATLFAMAICDESGKPLNPTPAQVAALGKKASGPIERAIDVIMTINCMRAADIKEMEKNFEATAAST